MNYNYECCAQLLKCGLLILQDACPPNPERYICKESEDFDETACQRCWEQYLFAVASGRIQEQPTQKGVFRVVDL